MSDDYHSDWSAISKTMLNLFCDSPVEYHATYIERSMAVKEKSQIMLEGTVKHAMTLEGKSIDDMIQVYPEDVLKSDGSLNGHRVKKLRAEKPGVDYMKAADRDAQITAVKAVLFHPNLSVAIQHATAIEKRFDAVIEGIPGKCKPDLVRECPSRVIVHDLKFTKQRPSNAAFRRTGRALRYWLQDAHYSSILEAVFGKPVDFSFLMIESKPPYRVVPYRYNPLSREEARDAHRKKLRELRECMKSGVWEDRWEEEIVLSPWDIGAEEEMVEVEQ